MNHGITAGGTRNDQLGAGMGDFIERYIFPGGELLHVSQVLQAMAEQGLEALDAENLRPHYARTLWAWCDALEAQLDAARGITGDGGARLPPLPGRQRDVLRARLDVAAPDARGAARAASPAGGADARRTIGLPVQPRLHVRSAADDLQVQVQGRRRPDHDGPVGRPGAAHHRQGAGGPGHHRSRRPCRRRWRRSSGRSRTTTQRVREAEREAQAEGTHAGAARGRLAAPARLAADRDDEAGPCRRQATSSGASEGTST